jgi:protocatechuate 3,4-dioxygenase beta subunit
MSDKYQEFKGKLKPTAPDILGPFYRPGSPFRTKLVADPSLTLAGKVLDVHGKPVTNNCYVEFWQADVTGTYDEQGPNYRGIQQVGSDGKFVLETVRPGDYAIGPHEFRCPHIHVKVWVGGKDVLTTQLYFPAAEHNDTDHWFDLQRVMQCKDRTGGSWEFDLVIP